LIAPIIHFYMPGIFGIVSREPQPNCERRLEQMKASMQLGTRCPVATLAFPDLGIFAGWVAHPGSFAAVESSRDEASNIALILGGECFRDECASTVGRRSWILDEYKKKRERSFEELNGIFSGLLVDRRQGKGFLFNDRYGIERLYVHESNGETYFASEAKALLAVLPELRAFDEAGVAQYLAYGCTRGERTLFRGIYLLPGGSKWTVASGEVQTKSRYFRPEAWEAQEPLTGEDFLAEFSATFQRILPRYSEDEESVGIALTGGLDTRMVMACLPETETTHPCYTFVGETGLTLDARLAAQIADVKGLKHQVLRMEPDFLRDFESYLDRTITATDGCAGALASHEIYFNARARELSPIRLTGNFGSEIFSSVSTFKPLALQRELLSHECAAAVTSQTQRAVSEKVHPVTFAAFHEIPWNLYGLLAAGCSQLTFRTPYLDNELVALAYRAPVAQRRSPLPALEVIRSTSPELARIPTDRGELLAATALGHVSRRVFGELTFKLDYYHKEGLPAFMRICEPLLKSLVALGLLGLHKFLPYRRWFQHELAPIIMERISTESVRSAPWWSPAAPERLARVHFAGRGNYVRELNAILTLEAVDRLLMEPRVRSNTPLGRSLEVTSEACAT
jgi:asparagine synthase (glutamine-hydrolysing)